MNYEHTERVALIERIRKAVVTGETFVILYRDIDTNVTLRKVIPIRLEYTQDKDLLLNTFCVLRMEYRSFRLDGLLEAYFRDVEI